jgi:biotin carboxylase
MTHTPKDTVRKLLILGANYETIPLIQLARNLGITTIVTDHQPKSPAKSFADITWDIDGTDIENLYNAAVDEKVNGVVVGVADRLVVPASILSNRLKLPTLASPEACGYLNCKRMFNDKCKELDISTIPTIDDALLARHEELPFPVFVKPVDSNSGKGMSICRSRTELDTAKHNALFFSKSKQILIEKYMTCDDTAIHLTIADGHAYIAAVVDRFTIDQGNNTSRVCIGAVYPSIHTTLYRESSHPKIQSLLTNIGVHDGLLTMQAFVEHNRFHFYDPGFRLQGEACDKHFKHTLGFDQKRMLIDFSLSGQMRFCNSVTQKEWPDDGAYSATVWLLLKKGIINSISGLSSLYEIPGVFDVSQRLHTGDKITTEMIGTETQVLARVYCSSPTRMGLAKTVEAIPRNVSVKDEQGNELLLNTLSAEDVLAQHAVTSSPPR